MDQGAPAPLRRHLDGHVVDTAAERGWSDLDNGDLIENAEREGYDVLITTDQNMRYQQNLAGRDGSAFHRVAQGRAARGGHPFGA